MRGAVVCGVEQTVTPQRRPSMMFLMRFFFRTVLLSLLMRLLGGFAPILRRLLRLVWR